MRMNNRFKGLKRWMLDEGLTNRDIERKADASTAMVSLFIKGERTGGPKAERIYEAFRKLGCPLELLETGKKPARQRKPAGRKPKTASM